MGIYVKKADGWTEISSSVGADLLGGVAGWAAIESVSGSADLATLKANNIAPESATADDECPGTYNITADGVVWRVAVFETGSTNSINLSDGVVELLMVGGGGACGSYGGYGGSVQHGITGTPSGKLDVTVGGSRPDTSDWQGYPTIIEKDGVEVFYCKSGAGNAVGSNNGTGNKGIASSVTGVDITYGQSFQNNPVARLGEGANANGSKTGSSGIVVVRAPKDAANNPKPDAPVAWGKFNSVPAGYTETGDWGPDAQGRTWKYYEFANSGDFEIDLTGGQYWVLAVGGGDGGYSTANAQSQNGQPGNVREGYWEFATNTSTSIKVGEKGANNTLPNGKPSYVGDILNGFSVQSETNWGQTSEGRGIGDLGYQSSITGTMREYATGYNKDRRPGRSGSTGNEQQDGCVIIATVTNDPSEWNPPGALPGLGGWATITAVSGTYTPHTYNDGVTDWVAYEFTANGTITTSAGLVDMLVVGGGQRTSTSASGGLVNDGMQLLASTTHTLTVASGLQTTGSGDSTYVTSNGDVLVVSPGGAGSYNRGAGALSPGQIATPRYSSITGNNEAYGAGQSEAISNKKNKGSGFSPNREEASGTVIIRVPAANAQGVSETRHSWLNFATVENGVVTSVNKTPDNVPYTTAVDEVPCGPEVAEGWNYDGSEFVAPEPDYSEQIKELEEQLKNLRGDL